VEVLRFSDEFSIARSFTATALYDLTDNAGIIASFSHFDYKFDKVFNGNTSFIGEGRKFRGM